MKVILNYEKLIYAAHYAEKSSLFRALTHHTNGH